MIYDPEVRRETPLLVELRKKIRQQGPMSVGAFVQECLWDSRYGYYVSRNAIGPKGDFTTAPEISQIFGELVGLWMVVAWEGMGKPNPVHIVEYGPGRGTLMKDALRAARAVPQFLAAANLHLVEASPLLVAEQYRTLSHLPVKMRWTTDLTDFPTPALIVANEFLDALPVEQWIKTNEGWLWRGVDLGSSGQMTFGLMPHVHARKDLHTRWSEAKPGAIWECRRTDLLATSFATIAAKGPLSALLIDYGHTDSGLGDTLQAVRAHRYEHPLCSPGEADLSAQVDFADVIAAVTGRGLAVDGPVPQAELLGALGGAERASRLMAANPAAAAGIETALARLMSESGMGTRFKAIGIRSRTLPPLPGLQARRKPAPAQCAVVPIM